MTEVSKIIRPAHKESKRDYKWHFTLQSTGFEVSLKLINRFELEAEVISAVGSFFHNKPATEQIFRATRVINQPFYLSTKNVGMSQWKRRRSATDEMRHNLVQFVYERREWKSIECVSKAIEDDFVRFFIELMR